jgi:hypothetical protein
MRDHSAARVVRSNSSVKSAPATFRCRATKARAVGQWPPRPKTRNEWVNTSLGSVSSGFVTSWHPNVGTREELLTGRPGEVNSQWRWAPWAVTLPPHGPGITLERLGSQGWLSAYAGTWAVPSQCRFVDGEAISQASSIGRTRDRYQGQQTALRAHFLWAESELRQDTARFESVRCCVPDRDSVGDSCPLSKQR